MSADLVRNGGRYEIMHSMPTLLFLHFQLSTEKLSGRATTFCQSGRPFESGRRASEIHFNTPTRMHPKQAVQAKPEKSRMEWRGPESSEEWSRRNQEWKREQKQ